MVLPMDSDEVAPGDGAFSTCIARIDSTIQKSSNNSPVLFMAWALTPAPPGLTSALVISGIRRCRSRTNTDSI